MSGCQRHSFFGVIKMKKLFALLFVLVFAFSVQAASITYTDNVTGIFDEVSDEDATLYIPQFNSSLGTLDSVTIDLSTALQASLGFENLKKFAGGDFSVATQGSYAYFTLLLNGVGFGSMSFYTDSQTYTVTLAKYDGTTDYAGTSGTIVASFSDTDTQTITISDPGYLAQFIGAGNMIFDVLTYSATPLGLPSNSAAIINTTGQAGASITYNYTIPEPATIAVLSLGGLLLKRKKTA